MALDSLFFHETELTEILATVFVSGRDSRGSVVIVIVAGELRQEFLPAGRTSELAGRTVLGWQAGTQNREL